MPEELIGEVYRYYEDKGMAYVKISGDLAAGDVLHIKDPEGDLVQTVDQMQVANQTVHQAYRGDFIGVRVGRRVREHDEVFVRH